MPSSCLQTRIKRTVSRTANLAVTSEVLLTGVDMAAGGMLSRSKPWLREAWLRKATPCGVIDALTSTELQGRSCVADGAKSGFIPKTA